MGYWSTIYSLPYCQKGVEKSLIHWLKSLITPESKNSSSLSSLSLHLYCLRWFDVVFIYLTLEFSLSGYVYWALVQSPLRLCSVLYQCPGCKRGSLQSDHLVPVCEREPSYWLLRGHAQCSRSWFTGRQLMYTGFSLNRFRTNFGEKLSIRDLYILRRGRLRVRDFLRS